MENRRNSKKAPTILELIFELNEKTLEVRKSHPLIKSIQEGTVVEDALKEYVNKNPESRLLSGKKSKQKPEEYADKPLLKKAQ
ncbi:hypothetical protein ACFL35_15210 [Candidatus Riflebacteria bacterium]